MEINTTYKAKIRTPESKNLHAETRSVFYQAARDTVDVYRRAVDFFINVVNEHWSDVQKFSQKKERVAYTETLTVVTKNRPVVPHPFGKSKFHKMPAYLRRAAISEAIGKVSSYRSNLENWKADKKGKMPTLGKAGYVYPTLYKDNCYKQIDKYTFWIKLFIRNTWDWVEIKLRKSDMDYMERHCATRTRQSPTLRRRGKVWSLDFPFKENVKLSDTDISSCTILAVDLGLNNAATCTAIAADGTILGRHFLKLPKEQDSLRHALNMIKKAQQNGSRRMPRLWAAAKGINDDIAQKTAAFIIDCTALYDIDVIVFEFLDVNGKKRGSKKQRLHHWKANAVQCIVTDKAHRKGMHISRVCAWGTSKYAYDGSGTVTRGIDGNYSICRFRSGKIYNCDLSATYNIGARYLIRETLKSLSAKVRSAVEAKVPRLAARSTCTWSDYINLLAELEKFASPASEGEAV